MSDEASSLLALLREVRDPANDRIERAFVILAKALEKIAAAGQPTGAMLSNAAAAISEAEEVLVS